MKKTPARPPAKATPSPCAGAQVESGVLARVTTSFSGRGYNIESLTVAEVDPKARTSRITIVTSGTPQVIEQIEAQLRRLIWVPVHKVTNWTSQEGGIEREMALVKVVGTGEKRVEALRMADALGRGRWTPPIPASCSRSLALPARSILLSI